MVSIRNGAIPNSNETYKEILDQLDENIKLEDKSVGANALNKCHGDWYEWMLAVEAWNFCASSTDKGLAVLLPNISRYDLARLYKNELFNLIEDLRHKVKEASSVQLLTSNPDFVILDRNLVEEVLGSIEPITEFSIESLEFLESIYKKFSEKCSYTNLVGYLSVKTSLRPDRRLQLAHEGSLMKALYIHMQTRQWIYNPPELKYYAFAAKVNAADQNALKTVATHSITTVSSIPQPAVDKLFEVNSVMKARDAFSQIL